MRNLILILFILFASKLVMAEPISSTKKQLSHVNHQIQSLQKTVQQNYHQQTGIQQQLKTAEITLSKLNTQILDLAQALMEEEQTLTNLKIIQEKTENKLSLQKEALAHQARAAYQLGKMQQWKIMLNQQEQNTVSRHMAYYHYLNESRLSLIDDIKKNLAILAETIQASKIHQRALKKLVAKKQLQQNQQQRFLALRQRLMTELGTQTKSTEQQIELLKANQKTLQETITKLQAQEIAINAQSFSKLQGKLTWPVDGKMMTSFGSLLDVGNQRSSGVVINAAPGTPVHSIYAGKVIFADWLRGFGLLIIINHGHNYMSLYARNRAIFAKVGQTVMAGDVIAATGNTGGYTNSSLYFEVRQNGTAVDPATWCR